MVQSDFQSADANACPGGPPALAQHLLVGLYLLGLLALGVRSLVAGDGQFGWGMFAYDLEYLVEYRWVMEGGAHLAYVPGSELKSKATQLAPHPRSTILEPVPRRTWYTLGGLQRWIPAYLAYLYDRRRPAGAVACEARLRYVINDRLRIGGTRVVRLPGRPDQPPLIIPGDTEPDGSSVQTFRHPPALPLGGAEH